MKKGILLATLLFSIVQATAAIQITRQPQPQQVSFGQSASFSVEALADAGEPILYQWYFNNVAMNGKTESSLTITNVQPEHLGNYYVKAGNLNGTQQSAEVSLTAIVAAETKIHPAVEVEITTLLGRKYLLQRSSDLINWVQVGDVITGTGTPLAFLFSSRAGAHTFYRTVERIENAVPFSLNGATFTYTRQNGSSFKLAFSGSPGGLTGTYVASGGVSDRGNYTYQNNMTSGSATVTSTAVQNAIPARYDMDFTNRTYNKIFQGSIVENGTFTY